jgi:hypothetical protein
MVQLVDAYALPTRWQALTCIPSKLPSGRAKDRLLHPHAPLATSPDQGRTLSPVSLPDTFRVNGWRIGWDTELDGKRLSPLECLQH